MRSARCQYWMRTISQRMPSSSRRYCVSTAARAARRTQQNRHCWRRRRDARIVLIAEVLGAVQAKGDNPFRPISALLTVIGMLVIGGTLIRTSAEYGPARYAPLAMGIYRLMVIIVGKLHLDHGTYLQQAQLGDRHVERDQLRRPVTASAASLTAAPSRDVCSATRTGPGCSTTSLGATAPVFFSPRLACQAASPTPAGGPTASAGYGPTRPA